MTVQREDLLIPQGSTYVHKFEYRDGNGAAINLTGFSARMQIRASVKSDQALYTSDPSHFLVAGPQGDVTLTIPAAVTKQWAFSRGVYDIELFTAGDATVIRLIEGKVTVDPEVTRT